MNTQYWAMVVGGLLILALSGCSDDSGGNETRGDDASGARADATSGRDDLVQASVENFELVDCGDVEASTDIEVGPGFQYNPSGATVPQGEVVKWVWADEVDEEHNVVGGYDCDNPRSRWFKSESSAEPGVTFCLRFVGEPGTYGYQCTIPGHCGGGMRATVEVTR